MLKTHEIAAVATVIERLQGSNLPIRRPSYNRPPFWQRPLLRTLYRPVPANTDWFDFLTVSGQPQYIALVTRFVATSYGDIALAGLEFRLMKNGIPAVDTFLAPGVELNKDGANVYPVIPRRTFQMVLETQTLAIQVRNPTGLQRIAIAALYGWFYPTIDSTVIGTADSAGVTDAGYAPMIGRPY